MDVFNSSFTDECSWMKTNKKAKLCLVSALTLFHRWWPATALVFSLCFSIGKKCIYFQVDGHIHTHVNLFNNYFKVPEITFFLKCCIFAVLHYSFPKIRSSILQFLAKFRSCRNGEEIWKKWALFDYSWCNQVVWPSWCTERPDLGIQYSISMAQRNE